MVPLVAISQIPLRNPHISTPLRGDKNVGVRMERDVAWRERVKSNLGSPDADQEPSPLFLYPHPQEFWALGPDLGSKLYCVTQLSNSLCLFDSQCPVLNEDIIIPIS